jgi:hypothetical protein
MHRRSYLAATATMLSTAAAGCASAPESDAEPVGETTTTTRTSTSTATRTTAATSVSASVLALQPAAVVRQTDYLTVEDRGQYLFVHATVDGGTADRDEFALSVAGEQYSPLLEQGVRGLWRAYNTGGYDPDSGGLLVFELPGSTDASDPEVVLERPGGERELDASLRSRVAAAPEFSADVSVPDTVPNDGSLSVAVSVTNEGDTPARFVGGLNRAGPRIASTPVRAMRPLVPASGEQTVSVDQSEVPLEVSDDEVGDGDPDARFTFYSVAGDTAREVRVVTGE